MGRLKVAQKSAKVVSKTAPAKYLLASASKVSKTLGKTTQGISSAFKTGKTAISSVFKGTPARIIGYSAAGAGAIGLLGKAGSIAGGGIQDIRQGFGNYTEAENLEGETNYLRQLTDYYNSGASGSLGSPSGNLTGSGGSSPMSITTLLIIGGLAVVGFLFFYKKKGGKK